MATTPALASVETQPLPASIQESQDDVLRSCKTKVSHATAQLFQCLATHPLDERTEIITRCGCFHTFLRIGHDCMSKLEIKKGAVIREIFSAQVGNHTREVCEPYWQQWGIYARNGENWFGSPEGVMCEVLITVILIAVCLFCFWDVLKDDMVEREELAEEAMKDMEQMLMKMKPSLTQTAEKAASLTIEAADRCNKLVSPHGRGVSGVSEQTDSSEDEENDRRAVASMQWMRSWSPRRVKPR